MFPLQSIFNVSLVPWPAILEPHTLGPSTLEPPTIVACGDSRFLEPTCPGRLAYRFGSPVGRQPLRPGRGRRSLRRQKNRTIANGLFANLKLSEDVQIALRSNSLEIVQQASSTTHLRQKTTPGGIVFLVTPHVIRQRVDAGGQNCDLDLRGSRIAFRLSKLLNQLRFFFFRNRHQVRVFSCRSAIASRRNFHALRFCQANNSLVLRCGPPEANRRK